MINKPMEPAPRQQQLSFAADSVWQKLPVEAQILCRDQLARLLETLIQAERQNRSEKHERQDLP